MDKISLDNIKTILTQYRSELTESIRDAVVKQPLIDEVFKKNITQPSNEMMNQNNSNIASNYHSVFCEDKFNEGFFIGVSTVVGLISVSFISICALKHLYRKCKDVINPEYGKNISYPLFHDEESSDTYAIDSQHTYIEMESIESMKTLKNSRPLPDILESARSSDLYEIPSISK